jgi:hypothetical protein
MELYLATQSQQFLLGVLKAGVGVGATMMQTLLLQTLQELGGELLLLQTQEPLAVGLITFKELQMYALIKNNIVEIYPYSLSDLKEANPQVSFPEYPSDELLAQWDTYRVVQTVQPSYNSSTQEVVEQPLIQKDGVWTQVWEVKPLPDKEIKTNNKNQAVQLLQQTDWTTIPDVANPEVSNPYLVNVADFVEYRNHIRHIAVYPPAEQVSWPLPVVEVWGPVSS